METPQCLWATLLLLLACVGILRSAPFYVCLLQVEEGPENYLVEVEQPRKDGKENRARKL